MVTQVTGKGAVNRGVVETDGRDDASRWEDLAARANLAYPPSYRTDPGEAVYEVSAGSDHAQVAERDLAGSLKELVTAVLAEGKNGD